MTILIATTVGSHRENGRIWLEGTKLERGGFAAQTPYEVKVVDGTLQLVRSEHSQRRVSGRRQGDVVKPIIEICNKAVEEVFPVGTALLAIVAKGKIAIRRAIQPLLTMERERRFLKKIKAGEPISLGSLFHGGGVMDRAVHDGLSEAGIESRTRLVAELEGKYLDASLRANADLFDDQTVFLNGPIQAFRLGKVRKLEGMLMGIPCTGASKSGMAKLGLSCAEAHPTAGSLFFTALQMIDQFQPAFCVLENVSTYQNTASMEVIRSVLDGWGYVLQETVLNGCDFGALENRDRLVVMVVSKGLADMGFSLDWFTPTQTKPATVAEILEPIAEDDKRWNTFEHLVAKEERDIAAGKGFRRQLYTPADDHVNTIGRGYQKGRSTEPFLRHPTDAALSRLFTPLEHARIKALPEGWMESLKVSATVAHEILGQGVIYPLFHAIGRGLGLWARSLSRKAQQQEACTLAA